tara:strand:- start:231 stop:1391 length:1161 start_codon:yes stop_codon:yes gene_type:complete
MLLKKNKLKRGFFISSNLIEIYYCISSILITLIVSLPPFRSISSISATLKGYYYVNYIDLGFIKRGLVGSIFKILHLSDNLTPSFLVLTSHVFFSILFSISFWIFTRECFKDWKVNSKIPFYTLFTLSPVLFLRLGYDIGRMDLICLVFSLFTIIITLKNSYSFTSKCIFISISISLQLLIHEASLFFYSPLIIGLLFYKYPNIRYKKLLKILPIFSLPLITGFLLLVFGRYEPGREELGIYLTNISKELETSMNVELIHTLKDSFEHSIILLTPKSLLGGSYLITVYYLFILFLVFKFLKLPLYLKLSIFSPLILSFIARDDTRFLAASTICCNLLILISAKESKLDFPKFFGLLTYIFLITIFLLGPWGIGSYDPLPLLKHYNF